MTLRYRLFGRPGNLDEFVDKVRRRDGNQVDVFLETHFDGGFEEFYYHYAMGVQTGETKLRLKRANVRLGNLHSTSIDRIEVERNCLKEAVETAEGLQCLGLKVTISGKQIDEAREGIVQYDGILKS